MPDLLKPTVDILCAFTEDSPNDVRVVLEDVESPITRKTIASLYQSVIDKSHVDFGGIPQSKGDITKYSGYAAMAATLDTVKTLIAEDKAYSAISGYVTTVQDAISYIHGNAVLYGQAFSKNIEIIKLEYNTFVYTCVEATTAILFQITDFLKTPSSSELHPTFRNSKYRADLFFIEQLQQFNLINKSGKYKEYLVASVKAGQENLVLDAFAVGSLAVASAVLMSIIPITRKVLFVIQDSRGKIADELELMAYFLELNQVYLKSQEEKRGKEKTEKVMKKQEKVRLQFLRLADKLRVRSLKAEELAKKNAAQEDRAMSLDSMRDSVDNDDFSIM